VSFNLSYQFAGPIAQPDAAALVDSAIELSLDRDEDFSQTSRELVHEVVGEQGVVYVQGHFPQSIPPDLADRFAVVHLDCDLYAPMRAGSRSFIRVLRPAACC
jgi:hypothetical protein